MLTAEKRTMIWMLCLCLVAFVLKREAHANILVVGSANIDTFLPVERLPAEGENLMVQGLPTDNVPGGKGCTQAIAAAKLHHGRVFFMGQFGYDGKVLIDTLLQSSVDCSLSNTHQDIPSGRGYVFLTSSGQVSAVVSGGSNQLGWKLWKYAWEQRQTNPSLLAQIFEQIRSTQCTCIMLQQEVPSHVNEIMAAFRQSHSVFLIQDAGGVDREIPLHVLSSLDFIMPNESELDRLLKRYNVDMSSASVVDKARQLITLGAKHVIITQGSKGATSVSSSGEVLHQASLRTTQAVDETGAGDCFRAAFVSALLQRRSLQQCLQYGCAAGACAVETKGAVPSIPTRPAVEARLHELLKQPVGKSHDDTSNELNEPSSSPNDGETAHVLPTADPVAVEQDSAEEEFPFLIGSRLNSMKDRPELWEGTLDNPRDFVRRQGRIKGLTCVDFNYPQHFKHWSTKEAKEALEEQNLVAGAVGLRYPSQFARGAMNHPDASLRASAVKLTLEAAQVALDLGCKEVVIWSAFDGYDYPFQVKYDDIWDQLVSAFRECCDAFPGVKFSVEYKPTDENTRFFTIPSTGAAMLLVNEVDRDNFGLTLDVGHMLMSGENPGHPIAMVTRQKKLFGIQLNDGYTRLAAEDGLVFGSVHPTFALEIMYQLRKANYDGHIYFDTFPQRSDPVKEAEYNVWRVKHFWQASGQLAEAEIEQVAKEHDGIGALTMMDKALRDA